MLPAAEEVLNCRLVGGFSIFVQLLVGTLGFSTLIIKRYFERPQRTWLVWGFDVGKQMISGSIMHMCNLLVSALSGGEAVNQESTNPCSWYVLNLTLDCTLGVLFVAGYLKLFENIAKRYKISGLESGHYGEPPNWRIWMRQVLVFTASMLCMKFSVVIIVLLLPFLVSLGDFILKPVLMTHSPRFEIIFVMAIWPLVLNIFESWVLDQFIKKKYRGPVMSATGHIPLSTEENNSPPYTATIEMHDASVASSRTLQDDSLGRHSAEVHGFDAQLSDGDEYVQRKRMSIDEAYPDQPFSLPTPSFTPTEVRHTGSDQANNEASAKLHSD